MFGRVLLDGRSADDAGKQRLEAVQQDRATLENASCPLPRRQEQSLDEKP